MIVVVSTVRMVIIFSVHWGYGEYDEVKEKRGKIKKIKKFEQEKKKKIVTKFLPWVEFG